MSFRPPLPRPKLSAAPGALGAPKAGPFPAGKAPKAPGRPAPLAKGAPKKPC